MTKDERIDQLSSRVMELEEQLRLAQVRAADSEDRAQVLQAERDALAARVERLRSACQLGIDMMVGNDLSLPKTFETMYEAMNTEGKND